MGVNVTALGMVRPEPRIEGGEVSPPFLPTTHLRP